MNLVLPATQEAVARALADALGKKWAKIENDEKEYFRYLARAAMLAMGRMPR